MSVQVTDSILQAERRARSYWDIDGLAVIVQAFAVLLVGLWLWYMNASGAWGRRQSELAAMMCIVAGVVDAIRKPGLIQWLKAKITYPRTGYVAPPAPQLSSPLDRGLKFSDFVVFCLLIAFWAVALCVQTPWICAAMGLVTGLSLWWNPARGKSAYLDLFGICCSSMTAAFLLSALHRVIHLERLAYTLIALGALGLGKGIATLLRYLRTNPVAQA